jgi:ribosomal protein L7/L12
MEALKIYRAATGKHLQEAKDFIDALVPKLIEQDPEKSGNLSTPQGSG